MGCEVTQSTEGSGNDPRFGTATDGGSRCLTVPTPGTGLGSDPGDLGYGGLGLGDLGKVWVEVTLRLGRSEALERHS